LVSPQLWSPRFRLKCCSLRKSRKFGLLEPDSGECGLARTE